MAIWFNGQDAWYSVADDATLTFPDSDWCLGFWLRTPSFAANAVLNTLLLTGNTTRVALQLRTLGSSGQAGSIQGTAKTEAPNPFVEVSLDTGSALTDLLGGGVVAGDGVWRLLIFQRDKTAGTIELITGYLSGYWERVFARSDGGIGAINGNQYHIAQSGGGFYLRGELAEWFQGGFKLDAEEIEQLLAGMTIEDLGKTTSLYLPMVTADATLIDQSGNGNDATASGSPRTSPHPFQRAVQPATHTATWRFLIDWDRDSDFDDATEDLTAYVMSAQWNVGFRDAVAEVGGDNLCTLMLDNSDRRFSPENSAGPYYGKTWQMRPLQITADDVVMYSGWVKAIQPGFGNLTPTATLSAVSLRAFLDWYKLGVLPLAENIDTHLLVREILDRAPLQRAMPAGPWLLGRTGYGELGTNTVLGGGTDLMAIDRGDVTLHYAGDSWAATETVYAALQDVVKAERGKLFINRYGQVTFWARRRLVANTTVRATVDNSMQGMTYAWGEQIVNDVHLRYVPRVVDASLTDVWALNEPVIVRPGQEKEVRAAYSSDTGEVIAALDLQAPSVVAGTLVTTGLSVNMVTAELGPTSARFVFRNAGTQQGTIETCVIRGRRVLQNANAEAVTADLESQWEHGVYTVELSSPLTDRDEDAQALVDYKLLVNKRPRGIVSAIRLVVNTPTALANVLSLGAGARIRVIENRTGHDSEHFIIGEEMRLTAATKLLEVTWYLEPAPPYVFWRLGRAGSSELGTTTRTAPI